MCGRFSLRLAHQEIQELNGYNLPANEWINRDQFVPRYNIAPRSQAPVIRRRNPGTTPSTDEGPSDDSSLVIQTMKWGLVPHWSNFEDKNLNTMNARSENLLSGGGMWNSLKGRKRCVVLCQGYYEWLTKGRDKIPHFIKPKNGKLMLLAGLYDSVILQDQTETLWSFTIVTTSSSSQFSWLHDRQPVILSTQEDIDSWLDTSSQRWGDDLVQIISRAHTDDSPLESYQVPKEVGKVGTESSSFILPIAARKDGIEAMFSKQKQAAKESSSAKKTKSASLNSTKRKRDSPKLLRKSTSDSAINIDEGSDDEIEILDTPPPSAKKTKL